MSAETQITQYGFRFGAAHIERLASYKGYVMVGLKTPKQRLELTVTPSGLIRIGKVVRNLEK